MIGDERARRERIGHLVDLRELLRAPFNRQRLDALGGKFSCRAIVTIASTCWAWISADSSLRQNASAAWTRLSSGISFQIFEGRSDIGTDLIVRGAGCEVHRTVRRVQEAGRRG